MSNYKYKPITFFFFTFLLTWISWLTAAYFSFNCSNQAIYILCMLPGLMAPFIISFIMIFSSGDKNLKKEYISKLISFKRINISSVMPMVLIMPIAVIVSILISTLLGQPMEQFTFADGFSFSAGSVPILLVLFLAASFEELGWRGYAMDSLESKYNFLFTTMIFATLWSLWHLPLFFVKGYYQYNILHESFWFAVNFMVSTFPMAFIISWLCKRNEGSIIVAVLFHFFVNIMQEITNMNQVSKCIETGMLIVFAVVIVIKYKYLFFNQAGKDEKIIVNGVVLK